MVVKFRRFQVLVSLAFLAGCVGQEKPAAPASLPEPSSGASGFVPPVVDPSVMVFPFPFRGVTYQMTMEEGQSGVAGTVYVSPASRVDEATAKVAVMNACAFIGRFPDPATSGAKSSETWDWAFERACL